MDGDLQNDPRDFGLLLEPSTRATTSSAVAARPEGQDALPPRPLDGGQLADRKAHRHPHHDNGCTLKAYRAGLIKSTPLYSEMHRFIPAITSTAGARITEIEVRHHPRRHCARRNTASRGAFRVGFDLVIIATLLGFSRKPLFCSYGARSPLPFSA